MGWDGCGGGSGTDLGSLGDREGLGMAWRVWGRRGEPGTGVEGLG